MSLRREIVGFTRSIKYDFHHSRRFRLTVIGAVTAGVVIVVTAGSVYGMGSSGSADQPAAQSSGMAHSDSSEAAMKTQEGSRPFGDGSLNARQPSEPKPSTSRSSSSSSPSPSHPEESDSTSDSPSPGIPSEPTPSPSDDPDPTTDPTGSPSESPSDPTESGSPSPSPSGSPTSPTSGEASPTRP